MAALRFVFSICFLYLYVFVALLAFGSTSVPVAASSAPAPQVSTTMGGASPACECFTAGWRAHAAAPAMQIQMRQRCAAQGVAFASAFDAGRQVALIPGAPAEPGSCPLACDCYGYGWSSAADPFVQTLGVGIGARSPAEARILTLACQGLGFDAAYQQGRSAGEALLRASARPPNQEDVLTFLSSPPGPCPAAFRSGGIGGTAPQGSGVRPMVPAPGAGGAAPVSVYTGPSVNEGRLDRRDPAVDAWVRELQADSTRASSSTRTISIEEAVAIARAVHDSRGFNLGWASTRDERIDFWVAAVAAVHYGHPIYNPLGGDPDWCVKNAGSGRPTSDDVIVRCSSREAWDCISGAGAEGYTFEASPIGWLPSDQEVFAPPMTALP